MRDEWRWIRLEKPLTEDGNNELHDLFSFGRLPWVAIKDGWELGVQLLSFRLRDTLLA